MTHRFATLAPGGSERGARHHCIATGALLLAVVLTGCSTHHVPLRYSPSLAPVSAPVEAPVVTVGRFADERGTDADWLGAIRGGYGNVLKRLRTDEPTSTIVETAFREALEQRGLSAPREQARYELAGRIQKLDCSYYVRKEAHAHLDVRLVALADARTVHQDLYRADLTEGGVGAGIFGSVDGLRELAERTLNAAIDQVLSDPAFLRALEPQAEKLATESPTPSIADRLRELESLRNQGLVDEGEYEAKRQEILDGL